MASESLKAGARLPKTVARELSTIMGDPCSTPCQEAVAKRKGVPFLLAAALALAVFLAGAGSAAAQSRSIRFDRLSIEEGLSQSTVVCMLQDRVGFIWLGTRDGLNRYDGYEFVTYKHDPKNPASLPASSILTLLEDESGDLWIGTEGGGLARWHRASDSFTRYRHDPEDPATLSGDHVRSIVRDQAGDLWLGTVDSGLDRFDPATGTFERFRHDDADPGSLGDDRIRALTRDRLGNLWIGTRGGLHVFTPGAETFIHYRHDPANGSSLNDDRVLSILEDRLGTLWVGTFSGLHRMDRATGRFQLFAHDPGDPTSLSENTVRAVFEDRDGRLWVGTDGGLNLFDRKTGDFARYRHDPADPHSLGSDRVTTMVEDRGGLLWVGTMGGGVGKWHPATWSFSHHRHDPGDPSGLTENLILAFSEDPEGRLWIGTRGGGLDRLDRATGAYAHFRHDPDDDATLSEDRVMALLHDRRGRLWIGTQAGGLNRYDPATGAFRHYRHDPARPDSLGADGVTSLLEDGRGNLWIGTFDGGLNRLVSGQHDSLARLRHDVSFARLRRDDADPASLSNDRVSCLAEDPEGGLWTGTFGGGLNRLDPETGRFERFLHEPSRPDSLGHDIVTALHVDPQGTLWIGTQGGGLQKLERTDGGGGFITYSERDGLANQSIFGILAEGDDALWISTNRGLSRFDKRTESFKNFDASHGLQSSEFNFGASYESASGEMFFGGVNGFNAFHPQQIERHGAPPPVVLTSLLKFGQPAALDEPLQGLEHITLGHKDHLFSFEFAALDYTAPHRNRYAYRLEGLTEGWLEWIDLGTHRRVSFTGLDPGSYVLRVKGANHDGIWNQDGVSLAITVQPPPWRSGWAYSLYAAAVSAAAFFGVRARRQKLRRRRVLQEAREAARAAEATSRIKSEFLANMSHEIRTPMSGVIGMTELLLLSELSAKQREQLETIQVSGEALLDILNDILDFSKIESMQLELEQAAFDLRALVEEALTLVAPTAAGKGLDLGYWIDAGTPETIVGDSVRTRQVLMNLLSNGIKFTRAGGVFVYVSAKPVAPGRYETHFAVEDSGIGIPSDRLNAIFQPFRQADSSTTREYGGTGLGLAICRRLSKLMGGRVWAESTPEAGSTFHFTIVTGTGEPAERSFLYRSDPRLAGRRALSVDANPTMCFLLSRQTDAWGMLTETAASAAEALEQLRSGTPIDLAIMDRQLMCQDEVSWVKGWGREGRCRDLPSVLLTPLASNGHATGFPGMNDYPELSQPVKPAQLFDVLTELLAQTPSLIAAAGRQAEPRPRPVERPSLRILVAEDNPVIQKVAPAFLRKLGYQSDLVATGREALEALERRSYDLIFMDVQMPEMDGFEATRRIHDRYPPETRPIVVAMTAHAMRGYREKCLEAGMDDYISKPLKLVEMQAALERAEKQRSAATVAAGEAGARGGPGA